MNRQTYYQPRRQFSAFPPVIKNLLIINVLFYLAQYVAAQTMTESALLPQVLNYMALDPPGSGEYGFSIFGTQGEIPGFWPWQFITYSFLHGGTLHLFLNMFALWMFGVQIENRWGSERFAFFFFACVLGAAVAHIIVLSLFFPPPAPGLVPPTVGASGGVYGVLLAFGMMFPNQPIYIYLLFPIKSKYLVGGLIVVELLRGISGSQTGVANFAHLGGALVGFLLIQYWRGKLPMLEPDQRLRM